MQCTQRDSFALHAVYDALTEQLPTAVQLAQLQCNGVSSQALSRHEVTIQLLLQQKHVLFLGHVFALYPVLCVPLSWFFCYAGHM